MLFPNILCLPWNLSDRSLAITEELQPFLTTMKSVENRSFDWNSVRLKLPSLDKQLPISMSPFDIPVRATQHDSPSSPGAHSRLHFQLRIFFFFKRSSRICSVIYQWKVSADSSNEEFLLKADDEEEKPLLRLGQPHDSALQNSKVCIS